MARMARGSSMNATILIGPWQFEQPSGSAAKTFLMNRTQPARAPFAAPAHGHRNRPLEANLDPAVTGFSHPSNSRCSRQYVNITYTSRSCHNA
jgi:hypothetical protein